MHEGTRQSYYMPSHQFQWNFASFKGPPQNLKWQIGFCFSVMFRGKKSTSPCVSSFSLRECFKIGRMHEALTASEKICLSNLWQDYKVRTAPQGSEWSRVQGPSLSSALFSQFQLLKLDHWHQPLCPHS